MNDKGISDKKYCINCGHLTSHERWLACGNCNLFRWLFYGPKLVAWNDTCRSFVAKQNEHQR